MALVSLQELKSYLGISDSQLHVAGLRLWVNVATTATVEVKSHSLEIITTGGASPGTHTWDLTHADYDTLTELVADLNTHAVGITAELLTAGAALSDDLVIEAAANCLAEANAQTLAIVDNYSLNQIIDRISDLTERLCDIEFEAGTASERYDGDGTAVLMLNNRPVNTVTRIVIGPTGILTISNDSTTLTAAFVRVDAASMTLTRETGAVVATDVLTLATYATFDLLVAAINLLGNGWEASVSSGYGDFSPTGLVVTESEYCLLAAASLDIFGESETDYIIYPERGWIRLGSGVFTEGYRNILADYTYGYAIIPGALREAVLRLCSMAYNRARADPTLTSERLGDHSWTRASDAVDDIVTEAEKELSLFRKFHIAVA